MHAYGNTYHFAAGVIMKVGGRRKGVGKFSHRKTQRRPRSKQT